MGYELEAAEHPVSGLKRIAREQLDSGIAELEGRGEERDLGKRVHEARKSLKKARAVVRMLRREVGEDFYKAENRRMRDTGRMLAPVRDADVVLETLLSGLGTTAPERLAGVLRARREHERERLEGDPELIDRAREAFAETRGRIDAWPIDRADSRIFTKSVKRTYKRGRKAFAEAYENPDPEAFHELRKRVKYLWYYARILRGSGDGEITTLEDWADEAADLLGLDHDLAVLGETIDELGRSATNADEREALRTAIEQRRLMIERRALPLLRRLFAEAPSSFAARVASRFDTWRSEQFALPARWLSPEAAESARAALDRKSGASDAEQRKIREQLSAWGLDSATLSALTRSGRGFMRDDLEELIERDVVAIGEADELDRTRSGDRLMELEVEIAPNEGSGLCAIGSGAVLDRLGWDIGFWVVLDDTGVGEGTVAVGRSRKDGAIAWQARTLETALDGGALTDDGEDCVRVGGWIYVFGSHYGSKEGPLERERQFVARFRESDAFGDGPVRMELASTGFRLHRLLNDALAAAGIELWPLAHEVREALVGSAIVGAEEDGRDEHAARIEPGDQPINIEGVAGHGEGVLVGLRYPTSADGHPLLIELSAIEALFSGELPAVERVWVVEGVGNRWVPAGIRGLGEGPDGALEALTGNLDSTGKGSVLIDAHPEAGLARSAHFRLELEAATGKHGVASAELVREFPGLTRVEGVAHDPLGRTFYVSDVDDRVALRYAERAGAGSAAA